MGRAWWRLFRARAGLVLVRMAAVRVGSAFPPVAVGRQPGDSLLGRMVRTGSTLCKAGVSPVEEVGSSCGVLLSPLVRVSPWLGTASAGCAPHIPVATMRTPCLVPVAGTAPIPSAAWSAQTPAPPIALSCGSVLGFRGLQSVAYPLEADASSRGGVGDEKHVHVTGECLLRSSSSAALSMKYARSSLAATPVAIGRTQPWCVSYASDRFIVPPWPVMNPPPGRLSSSGLLPQAASRNISIRPTRPCTRAASSSVHDLVRRPLQRMRSGDPHCGSGPVLLSLRATRRHGCVR